MASGSTAGSTGGSGPQVASITPVHGSVQGGERVMITGSGFVGHRSACSGGYQIAFGTDLEHGYAITSSSFTVLSDSQISAVVPPNFGGSVDVLVHNLCGTSPVGAGDEFTYEYPASQCLAGTCTASISRFAVGPLGHVALGFLDGFDTDAGVRIAPRDAALVLALHPRQWRLGQAGLGEPGGGEFGLARSAGAQISLDLTSDWEDWAYNTERPYYAAPYGVLSTYSWFIYSDVKRRLAAGQVPDYFDVWNEPVASGTVDQWLSVYETAYRAIKAADPAALVVGPSIASFLIPASAQMNAPGYELSLRDFLNWEMGSGVRFAAISWHEDGTTVDAAPAGSETQALAEPLPGGNRDYWSPAAIAVHVAQAKALIASYPALRGTQVFVNEYGPSYAANVPGWMVGDISALEGAGANEGMLTCVTGFACTSLLDGLIGDDGAPQMPYWVMRAYSAMSGERLSTSTSGSNLYTLATRAGGAIEALVGRADDCWGGEQCPQFHGSADGPVRLLLSVAVPVGVKVVEARVEPLRDSASSPVGSNDVPAAPADRVMRIRVRRGRATVRLGGAGDGDAFYVTVSPAH